MSWSGCTTYFDTMDDDYNNYMVEPTFLTNFRVSDENLYSKAIECYEQETNNLGLFYFENIAYDREGTRIRDCKSLHTSSKHDCTTFWRIFDDLKEKGIRLKKPKKFNLK